MNEIDISHRVRELLAEHLAVPFDDIHAGMNLVADLGADSLDEVGLVMAVEEAFNVDIDDVAADKLKTVHDYIALVERLKK